MLIYDLEIQKMIPPKSGDLLPDLKYCKGWTDYVGMGLACLCLYDFARDEYHIFDEFELDDMKSRFARTDLIVGFNIVNFDNKVLSTYDFPIPENKCYDLLVEIAKAAGTPNNYKGLTLDAICQANFGAGKSENGADAPKLYQFGNYGRLFNYCLSDVRLTKKLFERVRDTGHIINPRDNKWIRVARPR
jgi:hypothetical protein